ncbi:NOL7 protein, partial [Climacteris rufus]|nr:NOL7 protein [Climacteris rufus]
MARRQKAKAAAAGKRRAPAALPSPASSSEDEAPEEVSFGVAKEAAEAERKLLGEAARRHRELLKEKRRRHQELFAAQKVRRYPRPLPPGWGRALCVCARLTPLSPAEAQAAARGRAAGAAGAARTVRGQAGEAGGGDLHLLLTRTKGNYMAVCLKDQSLTGLHQQLAKDFLNAQLYGPHSNRVSANEFFSLANKRDPVKKAAVQFVDKSWGEYRNQSRCYFMCMWLKVPLNKIR